MHTFSVFTTALTNSLDKKDRFERTSLFSTTEIVGNNNQIHPPTILLHAFPGLTNTSLKVWTKNVVFTTPSTIPLEKNRLFEPNPHFLLQKSFLLDQPSTIPKEKNPGYARTPLIPIALIFRFNNRSH